MNDKTAVEVVESVKSGKLRVLRRWDEWLRVYLPWLVPTERQRGYATPVMTCPTCLAKGHKWKGNRKYGKGECE